MSGDWHIFHGGALGDLVLTLQLSLRLAGVSAASTLRIVSRVDPGDLSKCRPRVQRVSSQGLGVHWLHMEGDDPPPERLRELIAERHVLNALSSIDSRVHRRLVALGAREVYSFDPRPKPGVQIHITRQWQRELKRQGLLFPKCVRSNRGKSTLAVPDAIRRRGSELFRRAVGCWRSTAGRGAGCYGSTAGTDPGRYISSPAPILIHPGSGGGAKCWPLRCFLDAGRQLREVGGAVCFVVGPVELERWAAAELDAIRSEFPLMKCPEPGELLSLLAAARTLVSNDAGPAHLASLLGTPTVTIFGSTSPGVWRPLGAKARWICGDPESYTDDWGIDPARVAKMAREQGSVFGSGGVF